MSIWRVAPVNEVPSITLRDWKIYEIENGISRHAVGYDINNYQGYVSSRIATFDYENKRFISRSGRVILLKGAPGFDNDAQYVWSTWKKLNKVTQVREIIV